jgi:hypothetical protein
MKRNTHEVLTPRASKKPIGILVVMVLRAQNMRKKNLLGKSDPYVKLKMSNDKLPSKKTNVKDSNLKSITTSTGNRHACFLFSSLCRCLPKPIEDKNIST